MGADAVDREQPAELIGRLGLGEDIAETRIDAVGHEQADGEERHQLDDRLEGDGRHHALVMLAGIDVARPEQDREGGHDQSHVERGVLQQRRAGRSPRHDDLGVMEQQ